jgi:hypothetical protein
MIVDKKKKEREEGYVKRMKGHMNKRKKVLFVHTRAN